ncbi:unnamed protein product, partial [Gongylonema pulchrum]|uniref:DUF4398 domain-containing protein n=1 Tax=Gongylonema pulchrum TaxID=637853 RepID=A0A183DLR8_9BILA
MLTELTYVTIAGVNFSAIRQDSSGAPEQREGASCDVVIHHFAASQPVPSARAINSGEAGRSNSAEPGPSGVNYAAVRQDSYRALERARDVAAKRVARSNPAFKEAEASRAAERMRLKRQVESC